MSKPLRRLYRPDASKAEQLIERLEFTNRSMDRLMATARYGRQPEPGMGDETFEVVVKGVNTGKDVSVGFRLSDTEAVIDEMENGKPCGICGNDPCTWRMQEGATA